MIRISQQIDEFLTKLFPQLKEEMKLANMTEDLTSFISKCFLLALLFSLSASIFAFFVLDTLEASVLIFPVYIFLFLGFFLLALKIPKLYQRQIRKEIESDIFTPTGMLITLLESGNSIVSALAGVGDTRSKAGKYFVQIASRVYLGKGISEAIDDAIKYTPSKSFRRVLEPIKKSLKTGTDIHRNLTLTLTELSEEKVVEIVKYEKKLGSVTMIYMIFGTILPAISVVAFVLLMSMLGIKVEFFPFLLFLFIIILCFQLIFLRIFKSIRPMVRL